MHVRLLHASISCCSDGTIRLDGKVGHPVEKPVHCGSLDVQHVGIRQVHSCVNVWQGSTQLKVVASPIPDTQLPAALCLSTRHMDLQGNPQLQRNSWRINSYHLFSMPTVLYVVCWQEACSTARVRHFSTNSLRGAVDWRSTFHDSGSNAITVRTAQL